MIENQNNSFCHQTQKFNRILVGHPKNCFIYYVNEQLCFATLFVNKLLHFILGLNLGLYQA